MVLFYIHMATSLRGVHGVCFHCAAALSTHVTTESGISYLKFWLEISDVQSVVFSVRAGDEARVALSETSTTPGLYTTRQLLLKSRTQLIDFDDGADTILVRQKSRFRTVHISSHRTFIAFGLFRGKCGRAVCTSIGLAELHWTTVMFL